MTIKVTCITIDAHDPVKLAAFWAEALGWELVPNKWTGDPTHVRKPGDELYLEFIPTTEPKVVKNRMHFGLVATDLDSEMARLEKLGATHAWEELFWDKKNEYRNAVMYDPEGNEFCIGTPGEPEF